MSASPPVIKYASSGGVSIAYRVYGDGPLDLIFVPGLLSHIEFLHELPGYTEWLDSLASFARLVVFDKRGQGLSDRGPGAPSIEERMLDIGAVMDAVGIERAAILGYSEGASISAVFAATYPVRTQALILYAGFARSVHAPDYPFMPTCDQWMKTVKYWGTGGSVKIFVQSQAENQGFRELWAKFERLCVSPGAYRAMVEANLKIDVRDILPQIQVPTLVLHRSADPLISIENGRYLAEHIPGARLVELEGGGHFLTEGDSNVLAEEVSAFLTGRRELAIEFDRVLATVMLTDIVDSTGQVSQLGDRKWGELLGAHDKIAQEQVEHHRGRLIKSTGDGVLATFDGPGRAIACAQAISVRVAPLGIEIRSGVHTGEIKLRGDDIGGLAVHIAARVSALARSGEVLVTKIVTDLVAGANIRFTDRGEHELRGAEGNWHLFALAS